MKKIYILTFQEPENKNFGAILQSFAVQNLLGSFEKNTKLIDYRLKKRNILGKIRAEIEGKGFKEFHNKFLKKTKKIISLELLKSLNQEADIFIVGSDQVWRKQLWILQDLIFILIL